MLKSCENCRHHKRDKFFEGQYVCDEPESINYTQFTEPADGCISWKEQL